MIFQVTEGSSKAPAGCGPDHLGGTVLLFDYIEASDFAIGLARGVPDLRGVRLAALDGEWLSHLLISGLPLLLKRRRETLVPRRLRSQVKRVIVLDDNWGVVAHDVAGYLVLRDVPPCHVPQLEGFPVLYEVLV